MPNRAGLGGYQPPTHSNSSRRADFDLQRRVALLENQVQVAQRSYQWKTDTTATDPGHGFMKANFSPAGGASALYISLYDNGGQVVAGNLLNAGDEVRIQYATDASRYVTYTITASPTLTADSWWTVPVAPESGNAFSPPNNTDISAIFVARAGTSGGGGGGGGGGTDEVWIGPSPPTDPNIELWYDTDAAGSPVTVPLSYVHNQGVAASTWVITHNLGFRPNVTVEDSGGTTVEGEVVYDSLNQVTLSFSAPFTGIAYLS